VNRELSTSKMEHSSSLAAPVAFADTHGHQGVDHYRAPVWPLTSSELANVRSLLQRALPCLSIQDWKVCIDLQGGGRIVVVSRHGNASITEDAEVDVDFSIATSAKTLGQIFEGALTPRFALLGGRIQINGPKKLGIKFCDALVGRYPANKLQTASPLPTPTSDLALAKSQIKEFGYAIIKDALPRDQLERVRRRLWEQADAEREKGVATLDGGELGSPVQPNQRVWCLQNKGPEFIELLEHPFVDAFVPEFLDDYYLLSTYQANIVGPGGKTMYPHTDTADIPVNFTTGLNLVWFLDDVVAANGGTRVLPGSHRCDVGLEDIFSTDETIPVEGPAGSAFFFDQSLWHGTGANMTTGYRPIIITQFIRYWLRPVDNLTISLSDEVYANVSDRIRTMCGYRITNMRGTAEGQPQDKEGYIVSRHFQRIGVLRPSTPNWK